VSPVEVLLEAPGSTAQLTVQVLDGNGQRMTEAAVTWTTSDADVATVSSSGLVTAAGNGTATITATAGAASGTATVTLGGAAGGSPATDRAALVAFYHATDGPNWVNDENWLTDAPLEDWFGVATNGEGRVVRLAMTYWDRDARQWISNNVSGPIPPEFGELSSLEYVQFYKNNLTGPIPSEVGKLANLTTLDFNQNDLSGPIPPELGRLSRLTSLNLYGNDLSGPIPPELGNLANLTWLWLGGNGLSGPIPAELGDLSELEYLFLQANELSGPIPPKLGGLSSLTSLNLYGNDLSGPIPRELGNLANLTSLWLGRNGLSGPIPTELGDLSKLEVLNLAWNSLTGPIPKEFLRLDQLVGFYIRGNESLCVPGSSAFVAWLRAIEDRDDPETFCNATDLAVLESLYETAGGAGWTASAGWSGDGAVEEWHGVTADSLGRVVALDLSANALAGRLPVTLGDLARLTTLKLADNSGLAGRLPLSLTLLSLRTLHYSGTGLCAPTGASFPDWLSGISSHEGTGVECAPLTDRAVLEALYEATGGPDWVHSENWLTDAPLGEWYGVEVDSLGRVVVVRLFANGLRGRIPAEWCPPSRFR